MSSYQQEYQRGYEDGMEAARAVANQMYRDGVEAGLKEFRDFGDKEKTVFYHVTKILAYLGVENPKIANAFKGYFMAEDTTNEAS